jgi:hypothetical protein
MDDLFDSISAAMVRAASERSVAAAVSEAERHGLIKQGDGTPSEITIWERTEGDRTLRLQWRWYDRSQVHSIRPDVNILSLELRQGDQVIRQAEQRFEDKA